MFASNEILLTTNPNIFKDDYIGNIYVQIQKS